MKLVDVNQAPRRGDLSLAEGGQRRLQSLSPSSASMAMARLPPWIDAAEIGDHHDGEVGRGTRRNSVR